MMESKFKCGINEVINYLDFTDIRAFTLQIPQKTLTVVSYYISSYITCRSRVADDAVDVLAESWNRLVTRYIFFLE
jgi:hypothetical protein